MNENRIEKSAVLKSLRPDEGDLEKINAYTLEPLSAEQVFTFKLLLGTNLTDDRNFMPFSAKALSGLAKLYCGKTVVKDHDPKAENQIARVYDAAAETDATRKTELGEPYTELVAKCYMVRTPENEGLIAEIKAGIKKEVSTGFSCSSLRCSICGNDARECRHRVGQTYEGKSCLHVIEDVSDAYEISFVAVPAQPMAGTTKSVDNTHDKKADLQERLDKSREKYKLEV